MPHFLSLKLDAVLHKRMRPLPRKRCRRIALLYTSPAVRSKGKQHAPTCGPCSSPCSASRGFRLESSGPLSILLESAWAVPIALISVSQARRRPCRSPSQLGDRAGRWRRSGRLPWSSSPSLTQLASSLAPVVQTRACLPVSSSRSLSLAALGKVRPNCSGQTRA
jgi:hypothetical protein